MKSRDYWEKRALQRKLQAEQQAVKTADEMLADYDRAAAAIRKDIGYWLSKFAENNALSLTDARKLLKADELEEFRWTVEEYIAKGKKNLDGRWERQLTNASARVHISRLEAMETVLRGHVEALTGRRIEAAESLLSGLYEGQYLGRAFDLQKGIGVGWDLQRPDLRKLDKVLKTPWAPDGELYSDRIWKDKQALVSELNASLTQGLATGKPLQKIADGLAERLSVKKSAARRLLYTEAAAVTTLAEKDCYRDLEVEEYEILATLDSRTSEICRSMDGQHFPVSEMEAGVNAPPFHPNCRTDTCPWFDDWEELGGAPMRAARDLEDKGYKLIPAKMTYREWEAEFVKGEAVENTAERGIIEIAKVLAEAPCTIADDKVGKFMLKDGAKHAEEFFDAGYTAESGDALRQDIIGQFDLSKAEDYRENADGSVRFSIFMWLGTGKKRRFRTVWLKENEQAKPRLITAHREDEK